MAESAKKTEKLEVRLPPELKSAFQERCEAAGLTASEALRAFVEGQAAPEPLIEPAAQGAGSHAALRRLLDAVRAGSTRTMTALTLLVGYGVLAVFVAMAALKPLWGDHIGLFRMADGSLTGGIVSDTTGGHELLGLWTMPIAIGIAALLLAGLSKVGPRYSALANLKLVRS